MPHFTLLPRKITVHKIDGRWWISRTVKVARSCKGRRQRSAKSLGGRKGGLGRSVQLRWWWPCGCWRGKCEMRQQRRTWNLESLPYQKITRMIQVHCFSSNVTFAQWFVLALQIAQGLQMEFTICCLTWQCKKCVSFHRTGLFLVFVARCIDEGQYRGWHKVTRILLFNWLYVVSWFLRIFHMNHLSYWDWGHA